MFYIEKGNVKLTLTSDQGKEAIIGVLERGDFFGESCIASDRPARFHTAIALTDTRVVRVDRNAIVKTLRAAGEALYSCVSSLLRRNARIQQDFANNLVEPRKTAGSCSLIDIPIERRSESPFSNHHPTGLG